MDRFNSFSHRSFAVLLAWVFWWIPLGLHRLWMQQRFWWLHTLCCLVATVSSVIFFRFPENLYAVKNFLVATGTSTPPHSYTDIFLLSFTAGLWIALIIHDGVMVFLWPVPGITK